MRQRSGGVGGLVLAAGLLGMAAQSGTAAGNVGSTWTQTRELSERYRTTGSRIALGRSIHVPHDEEVTDGVVVVGGSVRIDGRVRDHVVVIGGNLDLGSQADVRGDVLLVGGRLSREAGAELRGSVSDVSFGDWGSWSIGGISFPTVDFGGVGRWLGLFGALFRIAVLAVLMAFVVIVARAPAARIGRSAAAEPGRAFLLGLAAEVLFVPALIVVTIALVLTIIGIPLVAIVIPAALITGFLAMVLGFTAVACRIGEWVEDRLGWRAASALLATAIGLLVVVGPSFAARVLGVAPTPVRYASFGLLVTGAVIEFVVWTIGLGATLMTGFGRWSTAPPPVPLAPAGAEPLTSSPGA